MKLALCHHYSLTFHGGGERFLIEFAKQLVKRGHTVTIQSLPFARRNVNINRWVQGIEYQEGFFHDIGDADVAYFMYAPLVHNFFRGDCPKIAGIHAFVFAEELQHSGIQSMNFIVFIRKFGLSRFVANFYFNNIIRKNLRCYDAVHIINKECLKLPLRTNCIYYIPNWIDTSVFKPNEEKNEKFSALFVGRKTKGFSTFVKIAQLLKHHDIDFFAIGSDLESNHNVKSLGLVTDVKELVRLYSKVHVLIYTSEIDVFPLSLLEACACETPVLALPTKAIEGLDLPISYASSVESFAQKLIELKAMWQSAKENYVKLTRGIRADVLKYDVNKVFPKYLAMLKEVSSR
jgi:glycosyltransferase involved in cell wall biosynthesis